MGIIAKLKRNYKFRQMRKEAQERAYMELSTQPGKCMQVQKEIDCLIRGHQWIAEEPLKKEPAMSIKGRMYCKHCGVYYHKKQYKK